MAKVLYFFPLLDLRNCGHYHCELIKSINLIISNSANVVVITEPNSWGITLLGK